MASCLFFGRFCDTGSLNSRKMFSQSESSASAFGRRPTTTLLDHKNINIKIFSPVVCIFLFFFFPFYKSTCNNYRRIVLYFTGRPPVGRNIFIRRGDTKLLRFAPFVNCYSQCSYDIIQVLDTARNSRRGVCLRRFLVHE